MSNSSVGGFLQDHARKNVWCSPNQDKQGIFKPNRLTDVNGAWIDFKVMWVKHKMPDTRSRFHVYQIGQIHPLLVGLDDSVKNVWIKLSDACNTRNLMANVYTVKGLQIHRSQVWYKVTTEKDLIFAIRVPEYSRIPIDLWAEDIFIRLYSNAFFQSPRANLADHRIYIEGTQVVTNADILSMQSKVITYRNKSVGYVTCLVNGRSCDNIDLITARPGDYIEFVYDGSIKRVVTFDANTLPQFESDLDNVYKYLLHYAGNNDIIEYMDDCDLYFVRPDGSRFMGLYYNKNNPNAMRMVTHKDYSIPVSYLESYLQANPDFGSLPGMQLVLTIRNSGYERPLTYESSRIKDLYKLDDDELLQAMIGINSTVSVWKATNLENSAYSRVMSMEKWQDITVKDAQEAYGYNAISVLVADTPQKTVFQSNARRIEIPAGLAMECTVYEYDAAGKLLGYYTHNSGTAYICVNPNTDLCEVISGFADIGLGSKWNVQTHAIDPNQSYRFYRCGLANGVVDDEWVDVTDTNQYSVINGVVTWFVDRNQYYTLVRSNQKHLAYDLNYMAVDGLITFSLREWREDMQAYRVMALPMGELDVFMNGKSLIEGLDYIVDFPRITINNKEYLIDPDNQAQRITIRFTNFCKPDLSRPNVPDVGFVQYGVLSFNNRFDIREDHVNRVVVDGALYRYDELHYGEEDFTIGVADARNGSPYAIRDIVVPMNDYLYRENEMIDPTFELRDQALLVDKAISDYMTLKIPEKSPTQPSSIPALYQVVSPFFNRIVHDLNSGALWDTKFTEQYGDDFVQQTCQHYEYLLAWDPVTDARLPDQRFVVIHPHNVNGYIDMGIYQFKFLTRVAKIYGSNRISLSGSIRVEQFGS
jgi:hypothetical protein